MIPLPNVFKWICYYILIVKTRFAKLAWRHPFLTGLRNNAECFLNMSAKNIDAAWMKTESLFLIRHTGFSKGEYIRKNPYRPFHDSHCLCAAGSFTETHAQI